MENWPFFYHPSQLLIATSLMSRSAAHTRCEGSGRCVCKLKFAAANAMIANYFDHGHAKYRSKRVRDTNEKE